MSRRGTAVTTVLLVLAATAARAQPACTDGPGLPENVTATLVPPRTDAGAARVPAVLRLTWDMPVSARERPGSAPDAYIVEAGSGPGFADVATAETPVTAYAVPLPNGTYYVRLRARNACGLSGATPEVEVPVTGSATRDAPNPVVLLESVNAVRERLADTAFIRVMGRVRNGWLASPAVFTEVTAVFDGPGGESSDTISTFVNGRSARLAASALTTDTVLGPGDAGCFLLFAAFPAFQITGVRVEVRAEALDVHPLEGRVEVDGVTQAADEFGDLRVSGRLANTGTVPTHSTEAWIEVTGGDGRVLDCASAPARDSRGTLDDGLATTTALAPGATAAFDTGTETVLAPGYRVRAWAAWDEADDAAAGAATPRYRTLREALGRLVDGDEQLSSPQERTAARDALRRETRAIATAP